MESSPSAPPPPTSVSRDDYDAANAARERFIPKTRFPHFLSLPNLSRSRSTSQIEHPTPSADTQTSTVFNADLISLDPSGLDDQDEYKDKYEWAMVYENQRGCVSLTHTQGYYYFTFSFQLFQIDHLLYPVLLSFVPSPL
jgi:hypothetical protein